VVLSAWDAALIAVKTIAYASTLGSAGAVFFLGLCGGSASGTERRRIRFIVLGLSILSICAAAARILVSAASMSGEPAGMLDGSLIHMLWQAGAGRTTVVLACGLALSMLGALSARLSWPAFLGASMAATSFAWSGHARSLNPDGLPMLLLGIHLLGVAFWLGALLPLLIVAGADDLGRIAATVARFGAVALYVVGGLVAAGVSLVCMMLGGATELWSSAYGRYFVLKLAFVACLLCLAAFNKLRLTPRLLRGDARAAGGLRASIRFELLFGALILAVTATLTTVTGPPALD
jgi:putative copper export protein